MKKHLLALTLTAIVCGQFANANPATPASAASQATASAASASAPAPAAPAAQQGAPAAPDILATAYLVEDLQSKQILTGKDLDKPIEPASLTKLMTAYLAFKALESGQLKPEQTLTPSETAWRAEGSRMFLTLGKPVAVSDLLKGLIVQSGNDAAITLAEAMGNGSEATFAEQMNAEAKRLGMNNTRFLNATGLPAEGHLTTVRDLAILSSALIRDFPQYYPIYAMKSFKFNILACEFQGMFFVQRKLLTFSGRFAKGRSALCKTCING